MIRTMKKIFSLLLFFQSSEFLFSAEDTSKMEVLTFYIDRKCGFDCSIDTNMKISDTIEKRIFKINLTKVSRTIWLKNLMSYRKLKENPNKFFLFRVYDLSNVIYLEFSAQDNHRYKEGLYREYYPNGVVKEIGNYTLYTVSIAARDNSWLSSLKNGKWLTYQSDGTLESEQHYHRGILAE